MTFNNPAQEMLEQYLQPFESLSNEEQKKHVDDNTALFRRWALAKKYGPQLYNYVTNGGDYHSWKGPDDK